MTNTSNQTYKELAIPYFREVFDEIDEVLTKSGIPYYLVGVSAVALELLKSNIKPSRGTKDIDFAIMLSSVSQFVDIVAALERKGFNKVKNAPCTMYHERYEVVIDLLPFGEVEEKDTFNFTERHIDLHVLGFKEVLSESITIPIEDKIANIPPLHGMIILKLVAWSDRPDERDNDLSDILLIIKSHSDVAYDEIVTNHYDTFIDSGYEPLLVSARVLGRKIAPLINKSERLQTRILTVLSKNTENIANSPIGDDWSKKNDWTVEYAVNILLHLKQGIEETLLK
jgi:predicted nucleotidyltransferase